MRTIIIESIEPNETEMTTRVTQSNAYFLVLTKLGLDVKELLEKNTVEFLSPGGAQYRVSFLAQNSYLTFKGGNA